ncbi:MAG: hypothetical protein U0Z44_13170 [Kouleothrix sp.]
MFEQVFQHSAFTGRSGAFFAYEGLGSVYWSMVAKLLLAAGTTLRAEASGAAPDSIQALTQAYYDIRQGLASTSRPPAMVRSQPTPAIRRPPGRQAARHDRPGQEEILNSAWRAGDRRRGRRARVQAGALRAQEWTTEPARFGSIDIAGVQQTIALPAGALATVLPGSNRIYLGRRAADHDQLCRWSSGGCGRPQPERRPEPAHLQRDGQIVQLVVQIAP